MFFIQTECRLVSKGIWVVLQFSVMYIRTYIYYQKEFSSQELQLARTSRNLLALRPQEFFLYFVNVFFIAVN